MSFDLMIRARSLRGILYFIIFIVGPQPLQLVFDTSIEDKPETPGEVPDPEKGGLGGARPLGMSTSSNSPTLPRPPEHPPPPPPTVTKKLSIPAPAPPPKLDQEVGFFRYFALLYY